MAGRNDYEERKQARIDGYKEKSEKASKESKAAYDNAHEMSQQIPCGQPILVGHHSEGRHRRHLAKVDKKMHKAFALSEKSEHYSYKAEAAELNTVISSDDPKAVEKLKEKLTLLEQNHVDNIARNKHFKKHGTMRGYKELTEAEAILIDTRISKSYSWDRKPAPSYSLTGETAEIRRIKERITNIEALEKQAPANITFEGGRIIENVEINRVQILFDDIPPEEVRKELKGSGFHWSRYEKAWQRQRSLKALSGAEYVVKQYYTIG